MTHELKILPGYYGAVLCGKKNFEIRKNDRGFKLRDKLILREWDEEREDYTGRQLERWVGYIHHGDGKYGLADGYVVLGLKRSAPMKAIDGDF